MRFDRLLLVAVVAWAVVATSWAQTTLSATDFRELVIARIMAEAPDAIVDRRDVLGLEITRPEGSDVPGMSVNLDRAFQEYLADPSQLEMIVGRWVRIAARGPEAAAVASDRIVSILRTAADIASYEQRMRADENFSPIVRRTFRGDLLEVMAFDSADSLQFATESGIAALGLSLEQAWALTDRNLPNRIGAIVRYPVEGQRGLFYLTGENGLTPSMLTASDVCVSEPAGMFLVVDRNAVLFGQSDDAATRRRFQRFAANVGPGSLSRTPVMCTDGDLAVLESLDR